MGFLYIQSPLGEDAQPLMLDGTFFVSSRWKPDLREVSWPSFRVSPHLFYLRSIRLRQRREEALKPILSKIALLYFEFLRLLLMVNPSVSIKCHQTPQGLYKKRHLVVWRSWRHCCQYFCWIFWLFLFFPSEFPSCFRQLSSPSVSWALSHCASVFPLHALPSPSVYFYKQTVVFYSIPLGFLWVFQFFQSSLQLPHSLHLPSNPECCWGVCFQLGLFCLVYWSFLLPYVLHEPPFL